MKNQISVHELLFDVDQVPVEAVIGSNGDTKRITIPSKKALVNSRTGLVLGVVSRDYRVVTNNEAVNLAKQVCQQAFPGISPVEWETKRAAAPSTLSYAHIDLMHRTHVLNYYDAGVGKDDPYTPFLRVTNSFNGARALRFDVGFMRSHCSNGVIFEEEVATIRASHRVEALAMLKLEIRALDMSKMWGEFSNFLSIVKGIELSDSQSELVLKTVLRLPESKENDNQRRKEGLELLSQDFSTRLDGYRKELGANAYSVFNTLTDIAARSPDSPYFQKERDTIEKRSGRWLKELARHSQASEFDLDKWIPDWEKGSAESHLPARNYSE